jgi:S1-C subfamily serine protease
LLASLKKFNAIKRPFLGIKYISLDKNIAAANHVSVESGDMIAPDGIVAGSPAEKV